LWESTKGYCPLFRYTSHVLLNLGGALFLGFSALSALFLNNISLLWALNKAKQHELASDPDQEKLPPSSDSKDK
jgi:hypothetical protein